MSDKIIRKCPKCGHEWEEDEFMVELNWKPHTFVSDLECPYCHEIRNYTVNSHNPSGVSHGEIHYCPNCNHEVTIIVYWDDTAYIEKPAYTCSDCGRSFDDKSDIEKDHKLDSKGSWHCKTEVSEGPRSFGVDVILKKPK